MVHASFDQGRTSERGLELPDDEKADLMVERVFGFLRGAAVVGASCGYEKL